MNRELVTSLLRQLLQGRNGLREIDPELPVPWTIGQWLALAAALVFAAFLIRLSVRTLRRLVQRRSVSFVSLIQDLSRLEEQRLRRKLSHRETVLAVSQLLREALRLVDVRGGGTGAYRTTSEWQHWSREHPLARRQIGSIDKVLSLSDSVTYAAAEVSLDDVRGVTTLVRDALQQFADADRSGFTSARPPAGAAA
ncbi:hypothetical protein [Roseiconus nitratireducens]|uniref:hypothetical protein n=1 Tax=Roseiconus nitratireducens TaxID=2605748 RepID=UPI001375FA04|nr:hypothetical protein [Roseiconus nitratireducens]